MGYKQVIIVRTDIKMSKGKTASQAAHASISAAERAGRTALSEWKAAGQKKIVLKVRDLGELLAIEKECKMAKIASALITDAGMTELEPGTVTALGVGPDLEEKIDKITGHLKIL